MNQQTFSQLLESSDLLKKIKAGSLIKGRILKVLPDAVIVYSGLKSESYIPLEQFKNEQGEYDVKVGDELEFVLETMENGYGETKLSREKAKQVRSWIAIKESFKLDETVEGYVVSKVKGGFTVDLQGLTAFLPGSLSDIRQGKEMLNLEGKTLRLKIVKIDEKRNNVVVSHRSILEEQKQSDSKEAFDHLFEGKVVKGLVKNLTEYGAFVDLGTIDGLLHITDMRWSRVNHPSEVVKVGEEIELVVLKFEKEKSRVSLGLKQLTVDPWERASKIYNVGDQLESQVSTVTDYGCFVSLDDGVEGLVHVSEMDWFNKTINPNKIVKKGDTIHVQILEIDQERHRISLGMKQCTANPWEEFGKKHSRGDKITGVIKSITEFGLFVSLDGDLDGLIHLSDLSWTRPPEEMILEYKKGQEIEVQILNIDVENQKISIGVKQLVGDPLVQFADKYPKNSLVKGVVQAMDDKKITILLPNDVKGTIKANELFNRDTQAFQVRQGDEIECRVVGVDRKFGLVQLSYKLAQEASSQEIKDFKTAQSKQKGTTIGSMIKEQLGFGKDKP
ncbi:MAG: 30S ribosomal protein S1 [Methylacidiphilales bacterium]|nr:30S ribosomal protein S1 [Candidatus Methylacidiphilales bacterium]